MARWSFYRYRIVLAALVGMMLIAPNVMGATGKRARGEYGIMLGRVSGTTFDMVTTDSLESESHGHTDASFTGGIFFEQRLFRAVWAGMSIDFHQFYQNFGTVFRLKSTVLNLSARVSYHHRSRDGKWSVRPGVASGVALARKIYTVNPSQFITLKPFVETVYQVSPKVGLILELGVFSTVWGGNDEYDITIRPTVFTRFGLLM